MDPAGIDRETPRATTPARWAILGAGPRAIGVLERFAAKADQLEGRDIELDLVDPHMPGAGRIWSTDESPLLLMNSRAADVTAFTDDSVAMAGPVVAGPTLAEWAEGIRGGRIAAPTAGTSLRAEIDALGAESFASRRLQALYLEWFFGQVLAALPTTVSVRIHRTLATDLEDAGEGWRIRLADGETLTADAVLLAAGHTDARPTAARHELAAFARRHGGAYVGPAQARDADLEALAPGQDAIVRGMGLAFIDLLALLTEGRGGSFEPDPRPGAPGRLRYRPSGREPRLWVGSRRGVPYHSKVVAESEPAGPRDLVHLTDAALRAREDAAGHVDYVRDVLPLIAAEIARAVPDLAPDPSADPRLTWLDDPLAALAVPAGGPETPCETERRRRLERVETAVVRHVEEDLAARTCGDGESARALFQTMLRIHGALVDLLPATRLDEGSRRDYPARWFSLFSFVDSGPPPHRLQQLLALHRAGVVRFLGPRVRVEADESCGRFRAWGAAGAAVSATALVDAFLPEPTLAHSADPLLRSLVAPGGSRDGEAVGREAASAVGRLEVDTRLRVLAPDGRPRSRLWAVGPWTSEVQVGAFARPRINAPVFRRNDALAAEVVTALSDLPLVAADAAGRSASARSRGTGLAGDPDSPGSPRPALGILGTGKLGTALARTALRRGLDVHVAGRLPAAQVAARIPGARDVERADLAAVSDAVVLAVPLHVALTMDPAELAGSLVVDATNAWGEADAEALEAARREHARTRPGLPVPATTTGLLAAHLDHSRVVKTLNHIGYHDLEELPTAGRAIAVAADDERARASVRPLLERLGLDVVDVGTLACSERLEPSGTLFDGWSTREDLERLCREVSRAA